MSPCSPPAITDRYLGSALRLRLVLAAFARLGPCHQLENLDLRVLGVTCLCSEQSLSPSNMDAGHLQSTPAQLFGLRRCLGIGRNLTNVPRLGQNSGDAIIDVVLGHLKKRTCLCYCPSIPALEKGSETWLMQQKTEPEQETDLRGL